MIKGHEMSKEKCINVPNDRLLINGDTVTGQIIFNTVRREVVVIKGKRKPEDSGRFYRI